MRGWPICPGMEDRRFKVRYSRPAHSANRAGHDNQEDVRKILAERFIVRGRSAVLFSRNTKVGVADSDVAIKCSRSRPTEQNLSIEETDEEVSLFIFTCVFISFFLVKSFAKSRS